MILFRNEKPVSQTWWETQPTGKIGYPKDIANTVIFLASDEAEYITGQTITVDGGRIIN